MVGSEGFFSNLLEVNRGYLATTAGSQTITSYPLASALGYKQLPGFRRW